MNKMTKKEADENVNDFIEELKDLANKRGLTLVYTVMHNVEDGLVQSGIANTDNIEEDMGYGVSGVCKMYKEYLMDQGKDNDEATRDVFVYAQSGVSIHDSSFVKALEMLKKKLEYVEMKRESEACKNLIAELKEIQERS